jgi:hypothetical protein
MIGMTARSPRRARRTCVLLALAVCLPKPSVSQDRPRIDPLKLARTDKLQISRLNGPVTLDGPSRESAWGDVAAFPLIQQAPHFGEAPSERTEVLLGYDADFLYIAGRLYDREPDKIQAPTKKRDAMIASTEWFGVLFDTFNDKENGVAFFTTPSGLRFDTAVFNDARVSRPDELPMNLSWRARTFTSFITRAGTRTASGRSPFCPPRATGRSP